MEKKITEKDISGIRHIIENCLQHECEVEDIIKFNAENDYMYDIVSDNLIDCRLLCKLLRYGYVVLPYGDNMVLRHKSKMEK